MNRALVFILISSLGFSAIPLSERNALIAIYNATQGGGWTHNDHWLEAPGTEDTWYGVFISADHVYGLDLSHNNLKGTLPSEIGDLPELNFLFLYFNWNLGGVIPSSLSNCVGLEYLDFHYSGFESPLPSMSNFNNMRVIDFTGNKFSEPFPAAIGIQPNLNMLELHLSYNQFYGPLPSQWSTQTNLEQLELSGNDVNSSLPSWLGQLNRLTTLNLRGCGFTGTIPQELGQLVNLQYLDLGYNSLTGPFSTNLNNLTQLMEFKFEGNYLNSFFPEWIFYCTNMQRLYLTNNQISGALPNQWNMLPNLNYLYLDSNQFSGSLPTGLGTLGSLKILDIKNNHFSGTIPLEISNLTNLQYLNVGENQLEGSIPAQFGDLTSLYEFSAPTNLISGPIPDELGSISSLRSLKLSDNNISGEFPITFEDHTMLYLIFLDDNSLGTVPNPLTIESVSSLKSLWINGNQFDDEDCHELLALEELNLPGDPPYVPVGFQYNPQGDGTTLDCSDFFPIHDPNFRQFATVTFDVTGDLALSIPEAAAVGSMDCSLRSIRDARGMEYFENVGDINVSDNQLEDLTPFVNLATMYGNLQNLDVRNNNLGISNCSQIQALQNAGVTVLYEPQGYSIRQMKLDTWGEQKNQLLTWILGVNHGLNSALSCP